MKKAIGLLVLITVLAVWAGIACSHEAKALGEFAIRNAAQASAASRFKDAGYPIKDGLICTASIANNGVGVQCSGKTTRGEAATAVGVGVTANHDTALKGSWIGMVNGRQVFHDSCVGPSC